MKRAILTVFLMAALRAEATSPGAWADAASTNTQGTTIFYFGLNTIADLRWVNDNFSNTIIRLDAMYPDASTPLTNALTLWTNGLYGISYLQGTSGAYATNFTYYGNGAGLTNVPYSGLAFTDWTGTFDGQEGAYYLNAANITNTTAITSLGIITVGTWRGSTIATNYLANNGSYLTNIPYASLSFTNWTGIFDGYEGIHYLARANHTGTQTASTISDFQSTVSNNVLVAAALQPADTNGWIVSAHTTLVAKTDTNGWTVSSHTGLVTRANTNGWTVSSHTGLVTKASTNAWETGSHTGLVVKTSTNGWVVTTHGGLVPTNRTLTINGVTWTMNSNGVFTITGGGGTNTLQQVINAGHSATGSTFTLTLLDDTGRFNLTDGSQYFRLFPTNGGMLGMDDGLFEMYVEDGSDEAFWWKGFDAQIGTLSESGLYVMKLYDQSVGAEKNVTFLDGTYGVWSELPVRSDVGYYFGNAQGQSVAYGTTNIFGGGLLTGSKAEFESYIASQAGGTGNVNATNYPSGAGKMIYSSGTNNTGYWGDAPTGGGGDVGAASNNVFTGTTNRFTGWVSLGTNLTKTTATEIMRANGDILFKKFIPIDTATGAPVTNSWISYTSGRWIIRENGTNVTLGL